MISFPGSRDRTSVLVKLISSLVVWKGTQHTQTIDTCQKEGTHEDDISTGKVSNTRPTNASQNHSAAWLFYVNLKEFSTYHDKMDYTSGYCCREKLSTERNKAEWTWVTFLDSDSISQTCSLGLVEWVSGICVLSSRHVIFMIHFLLVSISSTRQQRCLYAAAHELLRFCFSSFFLP